ncbi:hypothetical protein D9613_003937 [Agrocybe pediades]|uniref:Uncharacterized protein n=1 Tax=Agrocybe pediades TaxID=84607 RepID=A0A8H4QK83_9AGAR|nr:hypothetical protein D9613_003937 [Agrocybe pediades]
MDPSAINWNVTIDDFDSLLTYEDQSVWTTPDPSATNYTIPANSPWLRGTFHQTTTKGASVSLNITGPVIYVYGSVGPGFGSYGVEIDSAKQQFSAYRADAKNTTTLLYAANNLTFADHTIVLRNLGALKDSGDQGGDAFLLDFIQSTIQLAPAGATVKNVTFEEHDPAIKYTGTWGNNTGPVFSGGSTTFTNGENASFSFSFQGSAVYVFGDKKNDHGLYSVVLDGRPAVTLNGVSGCGGAFGMTCEQQQPSIKYLASNLDDSVHNLTLTNLPGVHGTFFDLDSIVVTVPSQYGPRQLADSASSPFTSSSPTAGSQTSPTSGGNNPVNTGAASSSMQMMFNPLFLLIFSALYVLRTNYNT